MSVEEQPGQFERAVPQRKVLSRMTTSVSHQFKRLLIRSVRKIPGMKGFADYPHYEPLHSGSAGMIKWYYGPDGTDQKPQSIRDIPWDYVIENQDEIPFTGLKEYWYPALKSTELPNNTPVPTTLLSENLVFFRDEQGNPCALENRCPHRSPLLSLGQVGVWAPGTITCRYHGLTFTGKGECVAFLADGPNSPACKKYKARSYPVEEHAGVIFVYMGEREPKPFLESQPYAKSVFSQKQFVLDIKEVGYNFLNILDNTLDMSHVGCLHRTCVLFAGQKSHTQVGYNEVEADNGVKGIHAFCEKGGVDHPSEFNIDEITWFPPNFVYHGPGELPGGFNEGYFWFVPQDIGNFRSWLIMGTKTSGNKLKDKLNRALFQAVASMGEMPGTNCFIGGDAAMQMSQGRIVRWDKEQLSRVDRGTAQGRKSIKALHKAEVAERKARGTYKPIVPPSIIASSSED
ncbi:MAG: Rieske 2Fe-2S domain-containing protein [Halieaceae bacterium]|nr:Rieske 2Fe-2S domain-containing protein [Halieaceae bacterium]